MEGSPARRRLLAVCGQLLSPEACAATVRAAATTEEIFGPQVGLFSAAFAKPGDDPNPLSEARLKALFGPDAYIEGPLAKSGFGRRFHNVDLSKPLSREQAAYVVDALSVHFLITFPNQDLDRFSLAKYERFANHFGAVQPMCAEQDPNARFRDRDKMTPAAMQRMRDNVDAAFPGRLAHLPDGSPAILTVTNVEPKKDGKEAKVRAPVFWHTDQDHERISCNATMFLVHKTPTARDPDTGTWLQGWSRPSYRKQYLPGAPAELQELREVIPLNGETAYADTAAAFAALPTDEQERLEKMLMVKYKQEGDDVLGKGYYCPLVRTNPRSGVKALYSPIYGNRNVGAGVPPVEIEGMTKEESKAFLDRLEAHCLQPQFRYDHLHRAGDLVVWNDYALLHSAPPVKIGITKLEDARLYYRIATKGRPELVLPRRDDPGWLQENFTSTYTTPPEILNQQD